jgi:hypothetical protein
MGITAGSYWCGPDGTHVEVVTDGPVAGGWFVRGRRDGAVEERPLFPAPGLGAATTLSPFAPLDALHTAVPCDGEGGESWLFAVTDARGRVTDCVADGLDPAALLASRWPGARARDAERCRLGPSTPRGPTAAAGPGWLTGWGATCEGARGRVWAELADPTPEHLNGVVFAQVTGAGGLQASERYGAWADGGRFRVSEPLGPRGPRSLDECRSLLGSHTTWVFAVVEGADVVDCLAVGHDPVGLLAGTHDAARWGPPPPTALRAAFPWCRVLPGEPAGGLPVPRGPVPDPPPGLQVAPGCPLPRPVEFPAADRAVALLPTPSGVAVVTETGGVRRSPALGERLGGGLPSAVDLAVAGETAWRLDRHALTRIEADGRAWRVPLPLGPNDRRYDHVLALADGSVAVWGHREVCCDTSESWFDVAVFDGAWSVDREVVDFGAIRDLTELPDGSWLAVGTQIRRWSGHAFGPPLWEGGERHQLDQVEVRGDGTVVATGEDLVVEGVAGEWRERPATAATPQRPVVVGGGRAWSVGPGGAVWADGGPVWTPEPGLDPVWWIDGDGGAWGTSGGRVVRVGTGSSEVFPGEWVDGTRTGVWWGGPDEAGGWADGESFAGPPTRTHGGAVGPEGRAVALGVEGTWWRVGGSWTLDPRPPPPDAWPTWLADGPLLVNPSGVWRWDEGWVRFLDVFHPTISGPSSTELLVVPGEPDAGPREQPFSWDGVARTPLGWPVGAESVSAGGGPGHAWLFRGDGGWRFTDGEWRRWWTGGGSPVGLPDGGVLIRSESGPSVLPDCTAGRGP